VVIEWAGVTDALGALVLLAVVSVVLFVAVIRILSGTRQAEAWRSQMAAAGSGEAVRELPHGSSEVIGGSSLSVLPDSELRPLTYHDPLPFGCWPKIGLFGPIFL
jgi:hypothetical protein